MTEAIYWRLYYADGHEEDEPRNGGSILNARGGALALGICDGKRRPGRVVALGAREQPVFYRRKSMSPGQTESVTDLTVYGRAECGVDGAVTSRLWVAAPGDMDMDCPEWAIDKNAIDFLVRGN